MSKGNSRVEMSNKTIAKLAYMYAEAQDLRRGGEVIGPTVRKLMEAAKEFDETWAQFGYED